MKRDISAEEFENLSKEKKKQYIAELIIRASSANPVIPPKPPLAVVMAGIPGAGKTEFLDTFDELVIKKRDFETLVRIDLDQIVTIYPKYTPQSYEKFRSQGNYALARCIDVAKAGRYNMMIDGTFAGPSGSSINNITRLLDAGYLVSMFYLYDDAKTAWEYTKSREAETRRGIDREGFLRACKNVSANLREALEKFGSNKNFTLYVVVQKKLRDKDYKIYGDRERIDKIIDKGYNIDTLRKTL